MVQENSLKKIIIFMGPTGVGKTYISNICAKNFSGEIINVDASSFRKGLNIGTAKPTNEQMLVKHHYIDFLSTVEEFSIKEFQTLARKKIEAISNKPVFLVGGSGLYINSVVMDYQFDELKGDKDDPYEHLSNEELHDMLKVVDLEGSKKIHFNNRRRVLRAIKIAVEGTTKISENITDKYLYHCLPIFLNTDRDLLYRRINQRVLEMFSNGWVNEVKELKEKNINISKIKEIGYNEISNYLDNKTNYNDLIELVSKKTRNYAKRQITWFKNKTKSIEILVNYDNLDSTIKEINSLIDDFLKE